MLTRFGTKITPLCSTGDGWVRVKTEDGRHRHWHISEMVIEDNEPESDKVIIDAALAGEVTETHQEDRRT